MSKLPEVWIIVGMFDSTGQSAIHCSGRTAPYVYRTEKEALKNLEICYPDQLREQRLGAGRRFFVMNMAITLAAMIDDTRLHPDVRQAISNLLHWREGAEDDFYALRHINLHKFYPRFFADIQCQTTS